DKPSTAMPAANPNQPHSPPAIRPTQGMIVGKISPGISVRGIILAHRSPLPLGKIRSPALPVLLPPLVFSKPLFFDGDSFAICHALSLPATLKLSCCPILLQADGPSSRRIP